MRAREMMISPALSLLILPCYRPVSEYRFINDDDPASVTDHERVQVETRRKSGRSVCLPAAGDSGDKGGQRREAAAIIRDALLRRPHDPRLKEASPGRRNG
jgi:hypothetical protein